MAVLRTPMRRTASYTRMHEHHCWSDLDLVNATGSVKVVVFRGRAAEHSSSSFVLAILMAAILSKAVVVLKKSCLYNNHDYAHRPVLCREALLDESFSPRTSSNTSAALRSQHKIHKRKRS